MISCLKYLQNNTSVLHRHLKNFFNVINSTKLNAVFFKKVKNLSTFPSMFFSNDCMHTVSNY